MYNQPGLSESSKVVNKCFVNQNKCFVNKCFVNQNKCFVNQYFVNQCFVNQVIDSNQSSSKSSIFMLQATALEERNYIAITLQKHWSKVGDQPNNSYSEGSGHLAFTVEQWQKYSRSAVREAFIEKTIQFST